MERLTKDQLSQMYEETEPVIKNLKTINARIELDYNSKTGDLDYYIFVDDQWVFNKGGKIGNPVPLMEIIKNGSNWLSDIILCELIVLPNIIKRKTQDEETE